MCHRCSCRRLTAPDCVRGDACNQDCTSKWPSGVSTGTRYQVLLTAYSLLCAEISPDVAGYCCTTQPRPVRLARTSAKLVFQHARIPLARLHLEDQGLTLYENTDLGFPTLRQIASSHLCNIRSARGHPLVTVTVNRHRVILVMLVRSRTIATAVVTVSATTVMHLDASEWILSKIDMAREMTCRRSVLQSNFDGLDS